jgi:hypothetical protein
MTTTNAADSFQVQKLEESLPAPKRLSDSSPRMPFKSGYKLTREQEDALVSHAILRLDQIEKQMGKRQAVNSHGTIPGDDFSIQCEPGSFLGKREKFTARYYNHVSDRVEKDTIFEHSNLTASLSQRICGQMIAKSSTFFYGRPDDDEWFTAEGVGLEDDALADKVKKYARHIAKKCKVKERHVQALEFAWVRGESVLKTTHQERFQIYKRTATYLIDEAGEPLLDAYGDYILDSDLFVPETAEQPVTMQDEAGMPIQDVQVVETGNMVLKRDGVTILPQQPLYTTGEIVRRLVTWSGPDSRICYYKDFICPLDAPGIQAGEADMVAHLYDKSVMDLAQMFGGQFAEGDARRQEIEGAVELLRNMVSDSNMPKSAADQPRPDFGERDTEGSVNNPKVQLAECWLTYDADGDGIQEEIMMVLDRRNKAPIFYDYTANVTLRGLRPFTVIRPMEVDGRWYGIGAMEYFEPEQDFIDLQLNRQNFLEGASGRVTFWSPWATLEGQRDPALKLNHGRTYTLREGMKAEETLSYVSLPEPKGQGLRALMELFMQFMQIKSGVVNGADQQISGLPTADTATGINEVRDSGAEMFDMFLLRLYPSLHESLQSVVDVAFTNLNERQVFTYFNGSAQEILELTPDDVRDLSLNIRLSITQARDRQILEAGNIADGVINNFYARPLPLQERTAPYARARLKSLKVPQPDSLIEPLDPALLAPQPAPGFPPPQ